MTIANSDRHTIESEVRARYIKQSLPLVNPITTIETCVILAVLPFANDQYRHHTYETEAHHSSIR